MLGKPSGNALALFKKAGSAYTKQGLKKLATLKTLFAEESMSALSLKMFGVLKGLCPWRSLAGGVQGQVA